MFAEIYEPDPVVNRGSFKTHKRRVIGWQRRDMEDGFQCRHCQAFVHTQLMIAGVHNRNHCPYCLWSRHLDHAQAGDRMSACKAVMQPIGLTVKPGHNKYRHGHYGELLLIHRCDVCGKLSINRIAADDIPDRLMEIFYESISMEVKFKDQLAGTGIQLLLADATAFVVSQLWGSRN